MAQSLFDLYTQSDIALAMYSIKSFDRDKLDANKEVFPKLWAKPVISFKASCEHDGIATR